MFTRSRIHRVDRVFLLWCEHYYGSRSRENPRYARINSHYIFIKYILKQKKNSVCEVFAYCMIPLASEAVMPSV
jgi:hypothetical protein